MINYIYFIFIFFFSVFYIRLLRENIRLNKKPPLVYCEKCSKKYIELCNEVDVQYRFRLYFSDVILKPIDWDMFIYVYDLRQGASVLNKLWYDLTPSEVQEINVKLIQLGVNVDKLIKP